MTNPEHADLIAKLAKIAREASPRVERLQRIASALREASGHRWVGLYDVDRSKGEVVNLAWDGPGAPEFPIFPMEKGLTGAAIGGRRTINVGEVSSDSRHLTTLGTTRSEIIVPILDDGGVVVGTIDVESPQPHAFTRELERVLEECAEAIRPLWKRSS